MYQLYDGDSSGDDGLPSNTGVRACVGCFTLAYVIMIIVAGAMAPAFFTVMQIVLLILTVMTMATVSGLQRQRGFGFLRFFFYAFFFFLTLPKTQP